MQTAFCSLHYAETGFPCCMTLFGLLLPQEVWSAALEAFPEDLDAATHVLSQLLVPGTGRLCKSVFYACHPSAG